MSVTSGFFNSLNGDRKYNATSISKIFDGLINDGVYMSIGEALIVKASSGMNIIVKPGRAWFNHTWTLNDSDLLLTIDPAELLMTRIDAVVLEVNTTDAVRGNTIKIVKGSPAESATKPVLTNNEDVHQYALAYITIDPKVTTIDQAKIENAVGTSATPYVNAIVKTIDTAEMYAQFTAQFNAWFDGIQDAVSDNAVLDLAMKMADLTKTDNSIPTLLYRYVLFPDTLTEAEKSSIESNPDLMVLADADKRQHIQIGDIIHQDTRVATPLPGFLLANGGVVQAADYPKYAKSLGNRKYLLRRTGAGGYAAMPWYEYESSSKIYMFLMDHCTCNGYTVALVGWGNSTTATYCNYAKVMIFNPKGVKIYSDNFSGLNLYPSAFVSVDTSNYSVITAVSSITFEDPNTVLINCADSAGSVFAKLLINGDTVTLATLTKVANEDVTSCTHVHIPGTNSLLIAINNNQNGMTTSGGTGKTYQTQYNSHYRIVDEISGSGSWVNNVFGTKTSSPTTGMERDEQDKFVPSSNVIKYTTAGMFVSLYYGYLKFTYGNATPELVSDTTIWPRSAIPEGELLDVCAKKGDWIPFESAKKMFNIKTNEIIDTPLGCYIGAMVFDERTIDLYVDDTTSGIVYLNGKDRETEELVMDKILLNQFMSSYLYKANASNFSAKNFIIIGHKLLITYPSPINSSSVDYIAPAEQYKEYYEISLDQIQLPKLTVTDENNTSRALVRAK